MKTCSKCNEEWPATREFYFLSGNGYLRPDCKACYLEGRKARKRGN